MPAQGNEAALLRRRTGDNSSSLPDEDVTLLFDEAETNYSGYSRKVILQAVVVTRRKELLAGARKRVTYQANETRENLSDIAKGLEADLEADKAELETLLKDERPIAVAMGVTRKVPNKWRDTP